MLNYIDGTSALELEDKPIADYSIKEAAEKLKDYSSVSNFEDDTWFLDKVNTDKNTEKSSKSLYFSKIKNKELKEKAKFWAISLLMIRRSIRTISHRIAVLVDFSACINEVKDLKEITNESILKYYNHLFGSSIILSNKIDKWKSIKSFFYEFKYYEIYNIMNKFILESYPEKTTSDKYIPDEVVKKLDLRMKQEDIPLAYKTVYWILRLIPNRITEVLSMKVNCLKQIDNNTYILSIPTFKQAGQYHKGSVKLIEIKYDGIGKYLIDLIKEQIKYTQENIKMNENNFLFYSKGYGFRKDKKTNEFKYVIQVKKDSIINVDRMNHFLSVLCEHNNIVDENNEKIKITTHCFRHNAITDRLTSGIFRPIDIMGLTAHHNTKMIEKSYTHYTPDDLRIEDKSIVFRGKIINTDNTRQIDMILKRPYAYSIHGLGICSDVSGCDKNKSECYRCPYMIPDFDQLDRYKMEMEEWKKKKEKSDKIGNVAFSELCEYWIESYEILIQRILKAISNEDLDIE